MRHETGDIYFALHAFARAVIGFERPVIIETGIIDPQRSGGADRAHVVTLGASFGKVQDTLFHK